jgi:hypothetical protein
MSDNRCRCLIDCVLIMSGACLGFGGLWLKMCCPAQDEGLSKGLKYYILYLACAGSCGDAQTQNWETMTIQTLTTMIMVNW